MRPVIASALLAILVLSSLPARADEPVVVDRTRTATILGDVLEDLARLEGRAQGARACRDLGDELARVRRALKGLQDEVRAAPMAGEHVSVSMGAGPGGLTVSTGAGGAVVTTSTTSTSADLPPPVEPEPEPTIQPMRRRPFKELLAHIQSEDFSDGKLRVLGDAAPYGWFTADQIGRILGRFDFGNDKLKALEILAPRLYDPENAYTIYKAFDFDSDKEKARKILAPR